jgi:hypothetical protein
MADRYQDRPFPSADQARGENDPLAELARLIGQNDPLGAGGKPPPRPLQSRANVRAPQYDPPQQYDAPEEEPVAPPSPPAWMQRARHETPLPPPPLPPGYEDEPEYQQPEPVHPLHRYAAQQPPPPPHQAPPAQDDYYEQPQQYADEPQHDPSRYDDALYGRLENGENDYQRDPAYPDDPYAYQGEYEEEPPPKKRSSGLMTVAAVLALAVVGTGAAFGYRTYVGSPRVGEPPIIKADNSPTKVMAAPSDGGVTAKTPDRLVPGDGGEKIVSREETPVDVTSKSGPRVVFPPLNQNANPPAAASVSPSAPMTTAANGTMPNNEPRKIKTLAVKGDAADNGGIPAGANAPPSRPAPPTRSAAAPPARNPASANASANSPMSLAPQATESEQTRVAANNPAQSAPAGAAEGGGSFLVSVSSQDSEALARESFRVEQGKYASVLGSRSPVVKRVDLANGKVKYRAMVGPYRTRAEAAQFCTELKAAGGQCFIP